MAGGDVVAGSVGRAEDGETRREFRGAGRPSLPGSWHRRSSGTSAIAASMEALDRREVGALVESRFFDGGADQEASVAARDEISLRRADDMLEERARGHQQAEHLSFDGAGGKRVGRDLARPRSGTVDDLGGVKCGLRGLDAGGASVSYGDAR